MVVSRNPFKIRLLLNNCGAVLPKIDAFSAMIYSFQVNIICTFVQFYVELIV